MVKLQIKRFVGVTSAFGTKRTLLLSSMSAILADIAEVSFDCVPG